MYLFSIISLRAFAGLCMISPAAILFTTVSSNFLITGRLGVVILSDRDDVTNIKRRDFSMRPQIPEIEPINDRWHKIKFHPQNSID